MTHNDIIPSDGLGLRTIQICLLRCADLPHRPLCAMSPPCGVLVDVLHQVLELCLASSYERLHPVVSLSSSCMSSASPPRGACVEELHLPSSPACSHACVSTQWCSPSRAAC
eukprot:6107820-Amphidinium_carterae.2